MLRNIPGTGTRKRKKEGEVEVEGQTCQDKEQRGLSRPTVETVEEGNEWDRICMIYNFDLNFRQISQKGAFQNQDLFKTQFSVLTCTFLV